MAALFLKSSLAVSLIIHIFIIRIFFAYFIRMVIIFLFIIRVSIILLLLKHILRIGLSKSVMGLTFILVLLTIRIFPILLSSWLLVNCYELVDIIKIYYLASFFFHKYLLRSDAFRRKSHHIRMNFAFWFIKLKFIWISISDFIAFSFHPWDSGIITFTFTFWRLDILTVNIRKYDSWWEWIYIALELIW